MAIVVGGESFLRQRGREEHVLVAKFRPPGARRPVFVICGQTPVTNHAAMVFLRRSHRRLARELAGTDRFCVVLRVESIPTYGAHAAVLARDVSAAAFAPRPGVRPAPTG
jgi:hypothetical protein